MKWFRLAAAQGDEMAQSNLGTMYGTGQGVPMDDVRAHMWFNLAAVKGDAKAVKNRDSIAKVLTSQQMAEAQKLARECQARNFKGC
ncbi:MAG: Secretory immunoglobulin A-binding protein EsiB [Nitrosomonadaceae bacterium]|nr:Secretory immunoglobulin A-binding protein EsiB [Nitrosomonadaceae bacterium]